MTITTDDRFETTTEPAFVPVRSFTDDGLVALFQARFWIRVRLAEDRTPPPSLDAAAERLLACLHDGGGAAHAREEKRIATLRLIAEAERLFEGPSAVAVMPLDEATGEDGVVLQPAIASEPASDRLH